MYPYFCFQFLIDFDILYPSHKNAIYTNWDGFTKRIIAELQKIQKPCDALKDALLLIENDTEDLGKYSTVFDYSNCF